jgi:hypothetical protein
MPTSPKNLSPAQLAMQKRAERTKRLVIMNLGLFVVVVIVGVILVGSRAGWFSSATPAGGNPGADQQVNRPTVSAEPDAVPTEAPVEPRKYPTKKYAFICDVSGNAQPRLSAFLPGALSQFNEKQLVDVMALSADGGFVSGTQGSVPMSSAAQTAACDFVKAAPVVSGTSPIAAISRAISEQAEAIFLLTTPPHASDFGGDPLAVVQKLTNGQKLTINCILFPSDSDSKSDLALFKSLADGTHGAYFVVPK